MELVSLCPFPALLLPWEADAGQASLTVVVKVTVQLVHDGDAIVADEQLPIGGDEPWDQSPISSLYQPSDRAPLKPRTDIVLVGHAYAPGGNAVDHLVATLKVGDFQKSISIRSAPVWTLGAGGLVQGPPVPFEKMPLRPERAALSQDNPVGVDPAAPPLPGTFAGANLEAIPPATYATFGPISASWRPRRRLLGEAGRFWALSFETGAASPGPAPRALDFRYFNAAPPDQQTNMLRQRADLELVHLHPSHPTLRTRLPALRPQVFYLAPGARRPVEIALRCDTLWIDTDRAIACLVWRGLTDVASADDNAIGTVLVVADPQGRRVRWEQAERAYREGVPIEATEPAPEDALAMRHDKVRTKEPSIETDAERRSDETRAEAVTGQNRAALPFTDESPTVPFSERTLDPRAERLVRPATPFGGVESASALGLDFSSIARPQARPARAGDDIEENENEELDFESTFTGSADDTADREPSGSADAALPFASSGENRAFPFAQSGESPTAGLPFTSSGATPAVPLPPPAPPPIAKPAPVAPALVKPPPLAPPPITKAAPVLLPPLAPPLVVPLPVGAPPSVPAPVASPPVARPPTVPPPPAAVTADPKEVPIAVYGAVSAELMIRRGERAKVLEEHHLNEPSWARIHAHWTGEMGRETARGESKLLAQFDEAYVETLCRLRKPIGVPEYAGIQVAIERGAIDKQLAALSLSLSDLMRVQRVWTRRLADDPELGKVLGKAIEEARSASKPG